MPDPTPPVTPPAAPAPTVTPVTTQNAPAPKTPSEPTLESRQTAETVDALGRLFDETPPPVTPVSPVQNTPAPPVPSQETKPPAGPATGEPDPKAGTPVGADDFQRKLDGFKPPPGSHPNVASGIEQLKKEATEQYTRAQTLETQLREAQGKVTEFETKAKENKLPENIEKELQSLRERVREIDYKSDPEFQKSYVQPVQKAETEIMGLLKQAGLKDDAIKQIQENGGIIAMSQSSQKAGVKDNPDMTMAEWVDNFLLAKTPSMFRTRISSKLATAADLIDKGRGEIEDFRANAQQRIETRQKQLNQEFEAGRQAAVESLGDIAKPKQIPPTATAEERQQLEQHNNLLTRAQQKFEGYIKNTQVRDPKVAAEILVKATLADMALSLRQADQATIKELKGKLDAIKSAGSHSRAGDHAPPPGPTEPNKSDLLKQSTEQALGGLFNSTGATP